MWAQQHLQAGALATFAVLLTGCGAPIIAETIASSVEQPIETTTTNLQENLVEGGQVQESLGSTVASMTTTTSPTLEYSQAWTEWWSLEPHHNYDSFESARIMRDYMSNNPNSISGPMGALCWAFHELYRSHMMGTMRWQLDDHIIPYFMEEFGVTSEQIGSPGQEATEAFFDLISGESSSAGAVNAGPDGQTAVPGENEEAISIGSTGETEGISDDDFWAFLRLEHEFAGDGREWPNAVRAVASPEMAAALRAGEGLPSDVKVYADALVAFAKERVGMEFDPSAERDDLYFGEPSFPGLASFMQAAKYHQDCKRAIIDDSIGTVDSSASPTTAPPVDSTTTTQPTVEETSPSTTGITAPPSATTTQPLVDDAIPSSSSTTVPASAATTQPQVENTYPSTTAVPVPPVDDSVTTTTTLPSGEAGPPPDNGGEDGLLDEGG